MTLRLEGKQAPLLVGDANGDQYNLALVAPLTRQIRTGILWRPSPDHPSSKQVPRVAPTAP